MLILQFTTMLGLPFFLCLIPTKFDQFIDPTLSSNLLSLILIWHMIFCRICGKNVRCCDNHGSLPSLTFRSTNNTCSIFVEVEQEWSSRALTLASIQWRTQEFEKGEAISGGPMDGSPPAGSGAEPQPLINFWCFAAQFRAFWSISMVINSLINNNGFNILWNSNINVSIMIYW